MPPRRGRASREPGHTLCQRVGELGQQTASLVSSLPCEQKLGPFLREAVCRRAWLQLESRHQPRLSALSEPKPS